MTGFRTLLAKSSKYPDSPEYAESLLGQIILLEVVELPPARAIKV